MFILEFEEQEAGQSSRRFHEGIREVGKSLLSPSCLQIMLQDLLFKGMPYASISGSRDQASPKIIFFVFHI